MKRISDCIYEENEFLVKQRKHRINEGMQIRGKGRSIDVIVRAIGGTKGRREAILEISGVPDIKLIHAQAGMTYWLAYDIEVGIRRDVKNRDGKVPMFYRTTWRYRSKYRKYQ